jgi:phosphohistidine phosphatase
LYLLRHAEAGRRSASADDAARPLSKAGRAAALALGSHLAEQQIRPALVLCSPALRARETLALLDGAHLGAAPVEFLSVLYLAGVDTLLARLRALADRYHSVLVIGHNPGFHALAVSLAGPGGGKHAARLRKDFPTATLATLEAEIGSWRGLHAGCARLVACVTPKDLP